MHCCSAALLLLRSSRCTAALLLCCSCAPLAALLLSLAFLLGLLTLNIKFFIREMPLELYHMPRWLLAMIRCQVPWLGSQLRDTALEPRAKRRAAELRQLAGLAPEVAV